MTLINHLKRIEIDDSGNARIKVDELTEKDFSIEDVVVKIAPIGHPVLGKQIPCVFQIENNESVDAIDVYESNIPKDAHGYVVAQDPAEIVSGNRHIEIESNATRVSSDDPHETPLLPSHYFRPIQFYKILGELKK